MASIWGLLPLFFLVAYGCAPDWLQMTAAGPRFLLVVLWHAEKTTCNLEQTNGPYPLGRDKHISIPTHRTVLNTAVIT